MTVQGSIGGIPVKAPQAWQVTRMFADPARCSMSRSADEVKEACAMEAFLDGLSGIGKAVLVIGLVGGCLGLAVLAVGRSPRRVRPSLSLIVFLGPALALMVLGLVVPALVTAYLSLGQASASPGGGPQDAWALSDEASKGFLINTLLWGIVVPAVSTAFGLVLALLLGRMGRRNLLLHLFLLPMAMAYVGASIAWGLLYRSVGVVDFQAGGPGQPWNSLLLMVVMIWVQAGFATVILASAIRGIPVDLIEAARLDGASGWVMLTKVMLPMLRSIVLIVLIAIMAVSIKVFDIVRTLTNGRYGTQVLANEMFEQAFVDSNVPGGSALAMLLLIAISPLAAYLLTRFHRERVGAES